MAAPSTARTANDSPFCDARAAMEKIIERLLAMASEGAGVDQVTQLLASDGTAMLRELMQSYIDRCAVQEQRVEVVGADGIERSEVRVSSRRVETPVGEIEPEADGRGRDGVHPQAVATTIADVLHGLRDRTEKAARRPRPTNKRVGASVSHTPQRVIDDAFAEAARRDPDHRRRWVVLVDGNRDQLRRIQRAADKLGVEITIVLDIVHVLEYLWRAAYAFHPDGTDAAEAWVEGRLLALLNGRPAGEIAKSLRLMIKSHNLDAGRAKPVVRVRCQVPRQEHRLLHYDPVCRCLPIATGVIEVHVAIW